MLNLINTDEVVARSIYHAIRKHVVYHGYLPDETTFLQTPAEAIRWQNECDAIAQTKGFYIQMFSESSARHKGMKNNPRIVIFLNNVFEGEIGSPPSGRLGASETNPGNSSSGSLPSQTANIIFAIHLLSVNSKQATVLNSILSNVLGERAFLEYYDNRAPTKRIFINRTSFADLDNPVENFLEKAYFYKVSDLHLAPALVTDDNVPPLTEITLETRYNMDEHTNPDSIEVIE